MSFFGRDGRGGGGGRGERGGEGREYGGESELRNINISRIPSLCLLLPLLPTGTVRSVNNLIETLHQSFYHYLLPDTTSYLSIGSYTAALGTRLLFIFLFLSLSLSLPSLSHTNTYTLSHTNTYTLRCDRASFSRCNGESRLSDDSALTLSVHSLALSLSLSTPTPTPTHTY